MTYFSYHATKEPAIDLGRSNSRSGWWAGFKGAWRAMVNSYEQTSPMGKQIIFAVAVAVTTSVILGAGAMTLNTSSRQDRLEQRMNDESLSTSNSIHDIKDDLHYIRQKLDNGGNHGSGSP